MCAVYGLLPDNVVGVFTDWGSGVRHLGRHHASAAADTGTTATSLKHER